MTLDEYARANAPAEKPEEQKLAEQQAETIARLQDDMRLLKARVRTAEQRMHEAERIRETVFGLAQAPVTTPDWALDRSTASGAPHVAVVVSSDFQWGEVIKADNMDGINSYDVATAQRRYRRLIDRSLDLSFNHLPKHKYAGCVYLRLGDTVSGDIHDELRKTNELSGTTSLPSVVEAESWGIQQLAQAFGRVHVVSVPGNHGRTTLKPPYKRVEENYDYLASLWLESTFRGDSRLTWQTPKSTDAVFELFGRKYLATHGDYIGSSGGQGFIGPAATIMRGMKKTMDEYARRGVNIDKMFVGHFHTAYYLGYGWSNGSLPGYSEFARGNRMTPEPPIQWIIYFHPRYGATCQWPILVEPPEFGAGPLSNPFA